MRFEPAMHRPSRGASWLVVALFTVFLLGGCSGDDTYLPALLADPMADYEAEGIELVDSWEQAEGTEWLSGKPVHARVKRTYRIADQSHVEQVESEAVAFAESAGWQTMATTPPTTGYAGAKELTPGPARLGISLGSLDPLSDPHGPSVLRITLVFGTVRFPDTTSSTSGEN